MWSVSFSREEWLAEPAKKHWAVSGTYSFDGHVNLTGYPAGLTIDDVRAFEREIEANAQEIWATRDEGHGELKTPEQIAAYTTPNTAKHYRGGQS